MWGNYAQNHEGFCIVYNPLQLINQTNTAWADSISYSQLSLFDDDDAMEDGGIVSSQHGFDIEQLPSNMPSIVRLQFRKETSWSYEDEFRLILADTNDESKNTYDAQIKDSLIEKIIFGFRADPDMILKVMNKFKHTNIMFFKATPSLSEYKIRHDDLLFFDDVGFNTKEVKDFSRLINRLIIDARKNDLSGELCKAHLDNMRMGDFSYFESIDSLKLNKIF